MSIKEKVGIVVSDKMVNTRIVAVVDRIRHKSYSKVINRTKRYSVYDQESQSKLGDKVRILETRPISKKTKWRLKDVLKKSST